MEQLEDKSADCPLLTPLCSKVLALGLERAQESLEGFTAAVKNLCQSGYMRLTEHEPVS